MVRKFLEKCPLCGNRGRADVFKNESLHYVACVFCSLVYLYNRPVEEEYKKMYEKEFQDKKLAVRTKEEGIQRLMKKKSYENKMKEMKFFKPFLLPNSKCLEIGGGWGTLAKVVGDKFGCDVEVIEPSEVAAEVAKDHYGLTAYPTSFEDFMKINIGKKYNFIFSYHVFEHIIDPNIFLEHIKKLLNPEGVLLMAMPDVTNPEDATYRFFHIEHCYYYSPKTVELMLNKHGFKVIKLWRDKSDMKVSCCIDPSITADLVENNEYENVIRILKSFDRRYKLLRFLKNIVYQFLHEKQQKKASVLAARALKWMGVVKA